MKLVSKMFVFVILSIVIMSSFVTKAHAYSWIGEEKLTPSTSAFTIGIDVINYNERHELLKVSVLTDKFFYRVEKNCNLFRVEIYRLNNNQTYQDVSSTFSNGTCELYDVVDCSNKCVILPRGYYIFKIIAYSGDRSKEFRMVFGPPEK